MEEFKFFYLLVYDRRIVEVLKLSTCPGSSIVFSLNVRIVNANKNGTNKLILNKTFVFRAHSF